MNGAQSLVRTLLACEVDVCFANPGTSEMHFVAALDQTPGMRCMLGLQRQRGDRHGGRICPHGTKTCLHSSTLRTWRPMGLPIFTTQKRAHSRVVNIVGDQATYHRPYDAPLTADTQSLFKPCQPWVRTSSAAAAVGRDAAGRSGGQRKPRADRHVDPAPDACPGMKAAP